MPTRRRRRIRRNASIRNRRVGKGALATCPPSSIPLVMVGTLRFAHPTICERRRASGLFSNCEDAMSSLERLIASWRASADLHEFRQGATESEIEDFENLAGWKLPSEGRELYLFTDRGSQLPLRV